MPGGELSTSARDGRVVVALCGELDGTDAPDAEAAIMGLVAPGRSLVIGMSALDFIDCASLGAVLRVQTLARQAGGDVVLAAPQRLVLRLLVLTGKDAAFCVHASVAAAVVRRRQPPVAVPLAAACGERCTPWEGSAVA
jgi:anti-sigma B factor antagonist